MPLHLVKILCYWYRHQVMFVKWGSSLSTCFQVTNGVRQGGVLSLLLCSGIRGSIDDTFVNHMSYVENLCIMFLSSFGLQSLLNICTDCCQLHDLTFNAKTSVCMFFRSSVIKQFGLSDIFISDTMCKFVNEVKCLDVIINSSLITTYDVETNS